MADARRLKIGCLRTCGFESHLGYMNAEKLAQIFHETYERLAPEFSYQTRKASAVPWEDVPENNKRLMVAVCAEILDKHAGSL